jgi:hypothetical protein
VVSNYGDLGVILSRRSTAKDPEAQAGMAGGNGSDVNLKSEVRNQNSEVRREIALTRWFPFLTSEFGFLTSDFFLTLLTTLRDSISGSFAVLRRLRMTPKPPRVTEETP